MNKKKSWFYKMLLSYLPAFFFLTSVLFLICFLAISENIKKTTIKSTQVFSEQVNQVIENFLLPIDRKITNEILIDDTFMQFFNDQKRGSYEIYQIVQKLKNFSLNFAEIDSIYVVRQADKLLVGEHMFIDLNNFADRDLILSQLEQHPSVSWTGKRVYYDQMKNESRTVVSLVRKTPFLTGDQGIIIVNVRVSSIQNLVLNMSSYNINFVNLYDREGHIIFRTEDVQNEVNHPSSKEMVSVKSNYSGWELSSGINNSEMFRFFSVFPYFWVILCFLSSLIGVLWIIYVTRRNYKPIESIMNRINEVFVNKNNDLFGKGKHDEMKFIALAIDNLLEQSNKFQDQYAEDLVHIRRHFFLEMVKGLRPITLAEWKIEMKRFGQEDNFDEISFGILEIDKYVEFCNRYTDRDQYLLKFVIQSIVNEIAENMSVPIWSEWITSSRLGILHLVKHQDERNDDEWMGSVLQMYNKAIVWVIDNLDFTVTIGMTDPTNRIEDLPQLCVKALDVLNYKPILGGHRVISYSDIVSQPKPDIFNHFQLIRMIAKSYRLGEDWEPLFQQFFHEIRIAFLPREDITGLINYLIFYLDREMGSLSPEIQEIWKKHMLTELNLMLEQFEMFDEFQTHSYQVLKTAETDISTLREGKANYQLIHEVKKYIEENYENPDLSLARLSDEFNLSYSYLSRLFRDEFGEKIIDYLVKVRVERAKELLHDTTMPVQDIAVKVGYVYSFSFIRVFKKLVGMTPGDYRK